MAKRLFRVPPKEWKGSFDEFVRKVVLPIATNLMRGKSNNTYDVTLAVAPATTTTQDTEIATSESIAILMPKTATAATAVGAGVIWTTCADNGVVTIHHDSNAATDRTFGLVIQG